VRTLSLTLNLNEEERDDIYAEMMDVAKDKNATAILT